MRRRIGGPLHWPEAARQQGVELDFQSSREDLVPVVPRVRPGKGIPGQDLEVAGHREGEVNKPMNQ
jgi:hypothetical protein